MSEKTSEIKVIAPYIPFKSFKSFIERLHNTATPPVIDPSLLQHMSGSTKSQLMSSLKFLGLVDANGTVKNTLKELVKSYKTDGWTEILTQVIFDAYTGIIGDLDLDSGTDAQLNGCFNRNGNVDGQMLDKAVRFYLAALKETDSTYSPHFGARKIRQPLPRKSKSKSSKKNGKATENNDDFDDLSIDHASRRFRIPIPGKGDVIIALPANITEGDWDMVKVMLDAYVDRLTKEAP